VRGGVGLRFLFTQGGEERVVKIGQLYPMGGGGEGGL